MKNKKIQIAIHGFKPMVYKEAGRWKGLEIELWENISQTLNLDFDYKEIKDFPEFLSTIKNNECDLAMAGITRSTKRAQNMHFSFNTLSTGLGVATRPKYSLSFKKIFNSLFSKNNLLILGVMLAFAIVNAHIIWIFEKGSSLPSEYLEGIFNAFWWSIVTFSTVGYGDIYPESILGKLWGIVAILTGLAIFGIYIGQISAALLSLGLESEIKSKHDLKNKRVGVKAGSTAKDTVLHFGGLVYEYPSVKDATDALLSGELDAVVADRPHLEDIVKDASNLQMAPFVFARQSYAFATPKTLEHKKMIDTINLEIIKMRESGMYDTIYEKYFD